MEDDEFKKLGKSSAMWGPPVMFVGLDSPHEY